MHMCMCMHVRVFIVGCAKRIELFMNQVVTIDCISFEFPLNQYVCCQHEWLWGIITNSMGLLKGRGQGRPHRPVS